MKWKLYPHRLLFALGAAACAIGIEGSRGGDRPIRPERRDGGPGSGGRRPGLGRGMGVGRPARAASDAPTAAGGGMAEFPSPPAPTRAGSAARTAGP